MSRYFLGKVGIKKPV